MKKLLSWLGAATIVATAPLNVIACKKETTAPPPIIEEPEFDYVELKNSYHNDLSEIFQRNIDQDFKNLRILDPETMPEKFEFISFDKLKEIANAEDLNDLTSQNHKLLNQDIAAIIDFTKLEDEINERIVKNVNYRPLLKGITFPIDSYDISNINILVQPQAVSLSFSYLANYVFAANANNDKEYDVVKYDFTINIIETFEIAEYFKEAEKQVMEAMIKVSNNFSFESDSGDLDLNADQIVKKGDLKTQLNDVLDNIQLSMADFQVETENAKLVMNKKLTQDASIANPKFGYGLERQKKWDVTDIQKWDEDGNSLFANEYKYPQEWLDLMGPMLRSEEGAADDFVDKLLDKESGLIDHQLPEEISEKISAHEDIIVSEPINHYNLNKNLENSDLLKNVNDNQYEFKIDEIDDFKAIAAYGANYNGVSISYKGERETEEATTVKMPNMFVPIKQYTVQENTQELYKLFLRSAIDLQQKYLLQNLPQKGYFESWTGETYFDDFKEFDTLWFTKYFIEPTENTIEAIKKFVQKSVPSKLSNVIPETIDIKKEIQSEEFKVLNTSSDFANGNFETYTSFGLFAALPNNYEGKDILIDDHFDYSIFSPVNLNQLNNEYIEIYPDFRTYFFSSGLKSKSEKTYFSFGKRGDFNYQDYYGEWTYAYKARFNVGADETW